MLVIAYNYEKHIFDMAELLSSRGMNIDLVKTLPQHGLIAFEDNVPIAAGFLRCIEGNMVMLDSYITSPLALSAERDKALDKITGKLIHWCKVNNITKVIAFSADSNTISRAERHGLISLPKHVFQILSL